MKARQKYKEGGTYKNSIESFSVCSVGRGPRLLQYGWGKDSVPRETTEEDSQLELVWKCMRGAGRSGEIL